VSHVNRGRAELNFSVWATYGTRRRETRLRAICELSRNRTMPPPQYALVHSGGRLSDDQIRAICDWTAAQPETPRR
jgi:hypothetical protein